MDTTFEPEGTFDFLALPAELRNMVYELCQETHNLNSYIENSNGLEAESLRNRYMIRTIVPKLRQVNKQVQVEVTPLMPQLTTLIFEESGPTVGVDIFSPHLPTTIVPDIHHAVFKLQVWCFDNICINRMYCDAEDDARANWEYLLELATSLPSLQTCEIELTVLCSDHNQPLWPSITHNDLNDAIAQYAEVKNVASIKVYKQDANATQSTVAETLWACWDRTAGWHLPTAQEVAKGSFQL